jgi:hypothetical protein
MRKAKMHCISRWVASLLVSTLLLLPLHIHSAPAKIQLSRECSCVDAGRAPMELCSAMRLSPLSSSALSNPAHGVEFLASHPSNPCAIRAPPLA